MVCAHGVAILRPVPAQLAREMNLENLKFTPPEFYYQEIHPPPPRDPLRPQTPTVTEVVYLPALINPGSRFDSFKTRLPVNGEHCGAVVRRASSQLPRATSERRSEVRVGRCKRG